MIRICKENQQNFVKFIEHSPRRLGFRLAPNP